MLASILFISNR